MVAKNEHTGDAVQTKVNTDKYRSGWDAIFNKSNTEKEKQDEPIVIPQTERTGS